VLDVPALPEYISGFDSRVREALNVAQRELQADPSDPELWMKLGMIFEAHSEASQAEARYLQAIELRPGQAKWWYRLAIARETSDKVELALEALLKSIECDSSYGPAHWRRGQWCLEMGATALARECFESAQEIDRADPAPRIGLARVHLWLGENEAAVALLEGSELLNGPNGPWAQRQLGTAYQRLGQEDKARPLLASSRSAKPNYGDPWKSEISVYRRGMAAINRQARQLITARQTTEAIRILEEARQLEPRHIPILRTLGAAYAAAGRMQDSLEVLHAATALDPDNGELLVDETWAIALGGDLEGALTRVLEIIEESPSNAKAFALKAQLMLDLGKGEEAIASYQRATDLGHRDPRMLVNIGKTQLDLQLLRDARATFELAAQQDPALQAAWIGQAITSLELGEVEVAAKALQRAEELSAAQPAGDEAMLGHLRNQIVALRGAAPKK
jgi:tetratricopeptide (TPR) repeat protein